MYDSYIISLEFRSALVQVIWTLAQYDSSTTSYDVRCKDSAEEDASRIHPTEVIQWDCFDEADNTFSRYDVVRATCGCASTPAPLLLDSGGDDGSFANSTGGIILWVFVTIVGAAFGGLVCCSNNAVACSNDCCNCCED